MTREEVMATMGIDATGVEKGLGIGNSYVNKWVQNVKEQEQGYTGWWNSELKRREEMEVASNIKAAQRSIQARKLLREREEARQVAESAAQAQANTVIGAGSVPAGWAEQAALKKAGIELEKKAAAALKETAEGGHASAGALREFAVLVREGFRGNYTRMIGSFSILLQRIGLTTSGLAGLGVAAAEAGAILYYAISTRNATKQLEESQSREGRVTNRLAEDLRKDIANMQAAHRISNEVADKYLRILANPTLERVSLVAKQLQPIGSIDRHDSAEAARLDAEHLRLLVKYADENETLDERTVNMIVRVTGLKHDMAKLDKNSIEYKQKQLDLDEAQHELDGDRKKQEEGRLEIQRKVNTEQKIYDEGKLHIAEMEQREREKFMPTIEELAKHGGFGGHAARQLERERRRISRDYFRGDTGAANKDIAQYNRIYDSIASRGIVSERSELRELNKINAEMALHIKNIEEGKAILKTKIQMS